jgi:hypothetical protein
MGVACYALRSSQSNYQENKTVTFLSAAICRIVRLLLVTSDHCPKAKHGHRRLPGLWSILGSAIGAINE